jgi:hypothetical protein
MTRCCIGTVRVVRVPYSLVPFVLFRLFRAERLMS